jgi:hypothetical protein
MIIFKKIRYIPYFPKYNQKKENDMNLEEEIKLLSNNSMAR